MGQARNRGTFEERRQAAILAYEEKQLQHYREIEMIDKNLSDEEQQRKRNANSRAIQLLCMMNGLASGLRIIK
jgi:hypothetical protein